MSKPNHDLTRDKLKIDQPATYSIQVAGYLDESWSNRLGGLNIRVSDPGENNTSVTTLSGALIDQAALFGVLKALYDMRLPLLSVKCMETSCSQLQSNKYPN